MAATERVFLGSPVPVGTGRVIASPFQFLFTGEDNLRIVLVNSLAGVAVTVQGRFLRKAGDIEAFVFTLVPTANRVATTFDRSLGEGFLLNLSVVASAGAPLIGQTYCMVHIIRGLTGGAILLGSLLGGYVTASQHLGFPGSPIQSSIEGGGYWRSVVGTNPAAGVEITETVPTGARWELVMFRARMSFGAGGGTRRFTVTLASGGSTIFQTSVPGTYAGGDVVNVHLAQGMPLDTQISTSNPIAGLPIPTVLLAAGTIVTITGALQADDDWGAPILAVREWLEAA